MSHAGCTHHDSGNNGCDIPPRLTGIRVSISNPWLLWPNDLTLLNVDGFKIFFHPDVWAHAFYHPTKFQLSRPSHLGGVRWLTTDISTDTKGSLRSPWITPQVAWCGSTQPRSLSFDHLCVQLVLIVAEWWWNGGGRAVALLLLLLVANLRRLVEIACSDKWRFKSSGITFAWLGGRRTRQLTFNPLLKYWQTQPQML